MPSVNERNVKIFVFQPSKYLWIVYQSLISEYYKDVSIFFRHEKGVKRWEDWKKEWKEGRNEGRKEELKGHGKESVRLGVVVREETIEDWFSVLRTHEDARRRGGRGRIKWEQNANLQILWETSFFVLDLYTPVVCLEIIDMMFQPKKEKKSHTNTTGKWGIKNW